MKVVAAVVVLAVIVVAVRGDVRIIMIRVTAVLASLLRI